MFIIFSLTVLVSLIVFVFNYKIIFTVSLLIYTNLLHFISLIFFSNLHFNLLGLECIFSFVIVYHKGETKTVSSFLILAFIAINFFLSMDLVAPTNFNMFCVHWAQNVPNFFWKFLKTRYYYIAPLGLKLTM